MLSNCLSKIDIIGSLPTLRVKSETQYKTPLGGILSIITISAIIGLSGYFIFETLNRDRMNVIYTDKKNINPVFNLFNTFIMFDMVDYKTHIHPNFLSILTPRFLLKSWVTDEQKTYEQSVPINSRCEKDYETIWPQFAGLNKVPYQQFCFDHTKINISKFDLTPFALPEGYSYANLQLWRCDNKTSPVPCAPQEEIDSFLKFSYMGLRAVNYAIENDNITHVNQPFTETMVFEFSTDLYRRYDIEFNNIEYTTDMGYVFEKLKKKKFAIIGDK